ncbi:hypothetical protein chiPu_0027197, partial [Chiloscyllium punctatum]|nr:hypothetical protein [Chiloscyllium punctatum]
MQGAVVLLLPVLLAWCQATPFQQRGFLDFDLAGFQGDEGSAVEEEVPVTVGPKVGTRYLTPPPPPDRMDYPVCPFGCQCHVRV